MRGISVVVLVIVALAAGCGSDSCVEAVPFSIDAPLSADEANRIAGELDEPGLEEADCEAACTLLSDENEAPDGSMFSITTIESCTLELPSVDASGNPVSGLLRCDGEGTRCEPD